MAMRIMFDKYLNRRRYAAYRNVFDLSSPQARTVIRDMCKAHSVFNGGFDPDPYINAFNAGERNAVLRILTILNMNPDDITDLAEKED